MNNIAILNKIKGLIELVDNNIDISLINENTNLILDLGFDSVRIIYFLLLIENSFKVSVSKLTCNDIKTIKELIEYIYNSRKI